MRVRLYAGTHACAITLAYVLRNIALRFPQDSAYACALARNSGTGRRTGLGPRQALWRTAAKSTSGIHIFKYMVIYVCILAGGRSCSKTVSSPRKRSGTRRRNSLPGFSIEICIYIYTHTNSNMWGICLYTVMFYPANVRATTFKSRLHLCGNKNCTTTRDSV